MIQQTETKILDNGYVKFIEAWGSDQRIIESARMSTDKGFLGWKPIHECDFCGCQWRDNQDGTMSLNSANDKSCEICENAKLSDIPKLHDGDEKLLAYLYNNKHSTPFEFAGMTLEIKAPIMVFREWHRHRTQCLIGSTQITLVTPKGTTFKRTIKEIFDLKHGGVVDTAPKYHKNGTSKAGTPVVREARRKDAWRTRVLPNCQDRVLRVLDEDTGLFHTANMKDVWESGVKEVFSVKAGVYEVVASAEHPFFTKRGWVKTKELVVGDYIARMGKVASEERPIPPALRAGIGVWTSMMRGRLLGEEAHCYKCGQLFPKADLELDHVVPVKDSLKLALDEDNLKPICIDCHLIKSAGEQCDRKEKSRRGVRWEKVEQLPLSVGEQLTYDIEVEGDHHNYCANDLVVHNSYNEMSARYVPLPDENYIPTLERLMTGAASLTTNKQAQSVGAVELIEENAIKWLDLLDEAYMFSQHVYQLGLNFGIPKELARLPVPVGRYSRMRVTCNLRNWLAFLTLRQAPNAQYEIRVYANEVCRLIEQNFPKTAQLFVNL
jgi:thymidylate synthase (FAD)